MSTDPTQLESAFSDATAIGVDERLMQWQRQLDSFAASFEIEIAGILETLAMLSEEDSRPAVVVVPRCDETTEFTLPDAPPPVRGGSRAAGPTADSEPDRLAALKARLSRQMASTGHSSDSTATAARTVEGTRP